MQQRHLRLAIKRISLEGGLSNKSGRWLAGSILLRRLFSYSSKQLRVLSDKRSTKKYRIKAGSVRSKPCIPGNGLDVKDDWATFELQRDVPAKPYNLLRLDLNFSIGQRLVQPTVMAENYRDEKTPYIAECEIGGMNLVHPKHPKLRMPLATNCGSDRGASGAGQLQNYGTLNDPDFEILALTVWENSKSKNGDVFDLSTSRINASTSISGDFLNALLELGNSEVSISR